MLRPPVDCFHNCFFKIPPVNPLTRPRHACCTVHSSVTSRVHWQRLALDGATENARYAQITEQQTHIKRCVFIARCYGERVYEIACCLSVCPSVTFSYRDHIGWNTSKIISRPNSLMSMRSLTPTRAIWCNGNSPKIRVE